MLVGLMMLVKYFEKKNAIKQRHRFQTGLRQCVGAGAVAGTEELCHGIPEELVELLEDRPMYSKSMSAARVDGKLTEWFRVTVGVRQGCGLSSYLFNLILEAMMSFALKSAEAGVRVGGQTVNNLRFADDIDLVGGDDGQLQELTDEVHSSSQKFGLKINVEKTKTMTIGKQRKTVEIKIEGETLEQVTEFIYLGGVITEDGRCTKDIKRRIGLASAMFGTINKVWMSNNITTATKVKLYETFVIPVMMYGSECWCLRKEDERRILVAEMSWLRRILGRSRRERIRNEVTRKELGQQVTLVDKIRKRRLTWFWHVHVSRMEGNRLPVVALYGQVEGTRSRGRQPKKWIDNVKEDLTAQGMNMREAVDNSRNRRIWRSLVEAS